MNAEEWEAAQRDMARLIKEHVGKAIASAPSVPRVRRGKMHGADAVVLDGETAARPVASVCAGCADGARVAVLACETKLYVIGKM